MNDMMTRNDGADMERMSFNLTGQEEHYLKRELLRLQIQHEMQQLSTPMALRHFGKPFSSDGQFNPKDSQLPILRYSFVHHIQSFPFLDEARDKEDFWQNKVQKFFESFASKRMSSSQDRNEETKRKKMAAKLEKLIESMMNAGIQTASGREEVLRRENLVENVAREADDQSLLLNLPEGNAINGFDINVSCVRYVKERRHVRSHAHAHFVICTKRTGKQDVTVARRYGAFIKLLKNFQTEFPGKQLPRMPMKNKRDVSGAFQYLTISQDAASISSASSSDSVVDEKEQGDTTPSLRRENQRLTLRAFLRGLVQDKQIVKSRSLLGFLMESPVQLTTEELDDVAHRKSLDRMRVQEQVRFFEIARERAKELNTYMNSFGKELVESSKLL